MRKLFVGSGVRNVDPVIAGVAVMALALLATTIWRTIDWSYGADTGTFYELIHNTFGGFTNGPEEGSHLRFHWSPALALLWPLVALVPNPIVIQIIQVFAIIATPLIMRALVRPYIGKALATYAALVTLLYPPLLSVAFEEFHELALWPVLALTLIYAADRERWTLFGLALLVACGLREDVCLIVAALGVALFSIGVAGGKDGTGLLRAAPRNRLGTRVAGTAAVIVPLLSLAVYYKVVIPRFGAWVPAHFYTYPFANGPVELLLALITQPLTVIQAIATLNRATYVLEAFVPLALLPFLNPWSLLALPGLAVCLLSSESLTWRMGDHYAALWAPYLLLGAVLAARRAGKRWMQITIAICVLFLVAFNPMHPAHFLRPSYGARSDARASLACVPADATLATHDEWFAATAGAHINARFIGDNPPNSEYLVVASDFPNARFQRLTRPNIEAAVKAHRYVAVCRHGATTAYRRTGP